MSVTKYIACKDCKVFLWIGQNTYLYTKDELVVTALTNFLLFDHASMEGGPSHTLFSCDEHELILGLLGEEYTEIQKFEYNPKIVVDGGRQ